jgi:hypothetical protein
MIETTNPWLIHGESMLIGGLEHDWIIFFHILEIVIPTDFHIFQRGRYTTNQLFFFSVSFGFNTDCAKVRRPLRL